MVVLVATVSAGHRSKSSEFPVVELAHNHTCQIITTARISKSGLMHKVKILILKQIHLRHQRNVWTELTSKLIQRPCSQLKTNQKSATSGWTRLQQWLLLHGPKIAWFGFKIMHATNIRSQKMERKLFHAMFQKIAQQSQRTKNASKSILQRMQQNHFSEWTVSNVSSENQSIQLNHGLEDAKSIKLMMFAIHMKFQRKVTTSIHVSSLWNKANASHQ